MSVPISINNSFSPSMLCHLPGAEQQQPTGRPVRAVKRAPVALPSSSEDEDSSASKRSRTHEGGSTNASTDVTRAGGAAGAESLRPSKAQPSMRMCVECGATQTPQWREGPQGEKASGSPALLVAPKCPYNSLSEPSTHTQGLALGARQTAPPRCRRRALLPRPLAARRPRHAQNAQPMCPGTHFLAPAGPKTLCNACGVRYVRAQQRANKRATAQGVQRPAQVPVPPAKAAAATTRQPAPANNNSNNTSKVVSSLPARPAPAVSLCARCV